jgi:phage tail-like protein
MPFFNPVPAFNFSVFFMNAQPEGEASLLGAVASAAVDVAKSVVAGSFSEVSGINAEMETEEYREGGRNDAPLKFAKWGKHPSLVFKKGVTFTTDLWDWHRQVLVGSRAPLRKNGIIILSDRGGSPASDVPLPIGLPELEKPPVAVWFFANGLPERLQGPSLNAKTGEIAIETLEVVHEGLWRMGPASLPDVGEAMASLGI